MRREWDGDKWTEERRFTDYAADGKRIDYVVTESSDCGIVTNSVSTYDLLGRLVTQKAALGTVTYHYDAATSRMTGQTSVAGNITRESSFLYNDYGEQVGVLQDGVTTRTDTEYETDESNIVWRVTTERTFGASTNACVITRERLTGLSDACRSCAFKSDLSGAWMRIEKSFNSESGFETETTESSDNETVSVMKMMGLAIQTSATSGSTYNTYNALGRIVLESRELPGEDERPACAFEYTPAGDLLAAHTYTNAADFSTETYSYDNLGNRTETTDALGNTVYKSYDPSGNVIAEWGATYPVRYTYDTQSRRTSLSTTRDGVTWDVTSWTYNPHTSLCTAKTYADGSQIQYTYTPDGLTLRTTYASGRWTENVYNAKREVIETLSSGGDEDVTYAKDEFGRITFEENDSATVVYSLAETGVATNELWTVGDSTAAVVRALDDCGRFSFNNGMHFSYSGDGKLLCLSNEIAKVEYQYSSDRLDVAYSIELANGRTFTRNTVRDTYRRGLPMNISSAMNGSQLDGFSYAYDALNRPLVRNSDAFGYNERSEVTDAVVSGLATEYGYDEIGNSTSYTANSLNQYTQFQYDQDGNLLSDGIHSFTYDSSSRLKTVVSNGVLLVTNYYDAKSRRVRKVTPEATTVFIYDDWNLIEERIAYANGTTSTIHYYWGKDISGELQGAGGVGGLLYQTIDGVIYIPCYDNNGNVTKYVDPNGSVVASYTYDAFGKIIGEIGSLADFFRYRFSTKYFDIETGLYYYGYRFYHPVLMRWLNLDPIEEDGGLNLYAFCRNNGINFVDYKGNDIYVYTGNDSGNIINDAIHQTVAVDIWSNECPPKKIGIRGFSFGYINEWGWNWPDGKWLGHSSFTLPGFWMVGMIYESSVVGQIVSRKKTTPEQDREWLKKMERRVGTKDVYSVGRHNCRAFSQAEFNNAP